MMLVIHMLWDWVTFIYLYILRTALPTCLSVHITYHDINQSGLLTKAMITLQHIPHDIVSMVKSEPKNKIDKSEYNFLIFLN